MQVSRWKVAVWLAVIAGGVVLTLAIVRHIHRTYQITLQGAIIRQDKDPNKQLPIADVRVTAITGFNTSRAKSDSSGFFAVTLPRGFRRKQPVVLEFSHPDYHALTLNEFVADKLYIVPLQPISVEQPPATQHPDALVSNVRVRYSVKTTTTADVGSAVKTFEVHNTGNVPCHRQFPCSPDGKWKATVGSTLLDAGPGNQFRNARTTCLAGPCPFSKIEDQNLSRDGRVLNVSARVWSDTVTFIVEAEVVHPGVSDLVRDSYPVIFGRTLTFSLPVTAEGPSIEAELNGQAIVFPLGPDLFLGWAQCTLGLSEEQNKVYRCELKTGYRFK